MPARGRAGQNNAQQIDPNQNFTRENNSKFPLLPKNYIPKNICVNPHVYPNHTST